MSSSHQHSQSTVPDFEVPLPSISNSPFPSSAPFFFNFLHQLLGSILSLPPALLLSASLEPLSASKHQASRLLTLFPGNLGERTSAKAGGGGGEDKATSVSDTNMAQCQHQYYVYAPSFSASHRVTALHLPHCPTSPFHPPIQVRPLPALRLSQLLFWPVKAALRLLPCLDHWEANRWEMAAIYFN